MRWEMGRRSDNIEDRRGMGGLGVPIVGGGLGTIVVLLLALFFGFDPSSILSTDPAQAPQSRTESPSASGKDPLRDFVSVVLADTEDTWRAIFRDLGKEYREPKLVLYTGSVQSACGSASSAVGPFYCPQDQKLYLDLGFFRALRDRLGAPGDFAQAYVIAHEVGHHVQNLLGLGQIRGGRGAGDNGVSVRRELQADCLAGVWAHHAEQARKILEPGDLEEAIARPPPSATTGCSGRARVSSSRTRSRTAAPSSASAGSAPASTAATSQAATRSAPAPCNSPRRKLVRPASAPAHCSLARDSVDSYR